MSHEQLIFIWFLLIAVLWIGFFFLEGFDFGVAMLYPVIGKDPTERRVMINTVGPTWDGNEVWLITAGGAMFAAFRLVLDILQRAVHTAAAGAARSDRARGLVRVPGAQTGRQLA